MSLSNKITIELYRIDVANNQFVKIDEVDTHRNLRWFDRLNGIGGATFDLEIQDPKADITNWKPYVTTVAIRIEKKIVWVGMVEKTNGNYSGVKGKHSVRCMSYLHHLSSRIITTSYRDQDAAAEAWNFIDTVQSRSNGELMIREGSLDTVGNTSDTLKNQEVSQAIMNQADNLVGYDFEFKPVQDSNGLLSQVNFNAFTSIGVSRSDYAPLEFGFNVDGATYSLDTELYNNVTGEGASTNTGVITAAYSDGDSQIEYTRRETVKPYKNILSYTTLNVLTESYLDKVKGEVYSINIGIRKGSEYKIGNVNIGDTVNTNLVFPNGLVITGTARIIELGYNVDSNGVILLEPKLQVIL